MNIKKFNDICLNITDGTHSTVVDNPLGSYYLLSCKNVKDGHINITSSDRKIDSNTINQLRKRTKMNKGDVVLTTVGTIGESSVIEYENPNYEFQRSVAIIKPNNNIVESKYLHYYLISPLGQSIVKSRIKGAAQPCLFLNDIKDIEINLPSLIEQQHIVNTIGSIDELIENYQSQADKICQTLEQALSVHDYRCLINEYDPFIIKSGIVKFDKEKTYLDTSCVEGINNISSGELITYSKRPSRANMLPIANSVWFAKMKDSNKIIIVTDSDDDLLNKHILSTGFMGIQATQSLPMSLLTAIIISNDFKIQRDLNSVGTTMAGVNNETFLKIQVPKLNETEINDFENKYSPLVSQLSYLRRKIILLKGVKDKLLKKYF